MAASSKGEEAPIKVVTTETTVAAPLEAAWRSRTTPDAIVRWDGASDDRHRPPATVDLRAAGAISSRIEGKAGSRGFDAEAADPVGMKRQGWQAIPDDSAHIEAERSS